MKLPIYFQRHQVVDIFLLKWNGQLAVSDLVPNLYIFANVYFLVKIYLKKFYNYLQKRLIGLALFSARRNPCLEGG